MCLYTNQVKIKTAEKDIVCYKVMKKIRMGNNYVFSSIYYPKYYIIGETYNNDLSLCLLSKTNKRNLNILEEDDLFNDTFEENNDLYVIGDNKRTFEYSCNAGFHSYIDKKTVEYVYHLILAYNRHLKIVKCVIPKGANYVEGYHYTICDDILNEPGYVSDMIKIVEEVSLQN